MILQVLATDIFLQSLEYLYFYPKHADNEIESYYQP